MAPVVSPSPFFRGTILATTVIREPSGRSMMTSTSRAEDILPHRTAAIGHLECFIRFPSAERILIDPQNLSPWSPVFGVRPHNAAAQRLNSTILPDVSQEYTPTGPRSKRARNLWS